VPAPPVGQRPPLSVFDTQDFVPAAAEGLPAAAPPPPPPAPDLAGRPGRIGPYAVLEEVGRGGMGAVYKARDERLGRLLALKMIRSAGHDAAAAARFLREARAVAALQHPNIVQVYDVGIDAGQPYIALEYCGGGSLADQRDGTPWPPRHAARVIQLLAQAMDCAHQTGVIHRDLKPANVLLTTDGVPKITDFGLAKRLEEDVGQTQTGDIVGTPSYMSPEQAEGKTRLIGQLSDVYALGAILYELLTGRPPFQAATPLDTLLQVLEGEPVAPRRLQPQTPPDLEIICLKCLQKEPGRRYPSAGALAEDLERFLEGRPVTAAPAGWGRRLRRLFQARPVVPAGPPRPEGLPEFLRQRSGAEQALREQERLLRVVVENVQEGVIVLDAAGRVARANAAAERLFGGPLAGLSLDRWGARDLWFRDGRSPCPPEELPAARALRGETVAEAELFVRPASRPEGAWLGVRADPLPGEDGTPAGAVVLVREGTGQHLALYRSLVESLRLNVFRKDAAGCFTFANDRFCQTLGLARGEVLGRTDADLFAPELAEKYRRDDSHILADRAVAEEMEEHRRAACGPRCRCGGGDPAVGETRWLQVLLGPVFDGDGRAVGTQGAFWDVTARMQAERQALEAAAGLRKANEELARSNADLEQFAYVASHDLQEPLRMVASFTELLGRRYRGRLDADADEFIAFAVDGATRMQRLINDLLAYSRVTTRGGAPALTPARDAFDHAVSNLGAALRDSGALVTCGPLPEVWADATQLAQLFQNLIGNAVKFCRGRRPVVLVSAVPQGREWLFAVRDNGIGIEAKHLERIFDIFQRLPTREQYPGTGIGLALCKKIVERHGGRIWAESQPGLGSTFSFTLAGRPDGPD
jgi:PAS domain S-box-containing protein